ncbi:unnamed protein product, partial [Leptidea sinapis]
LATWLTAPKWRISNRH